MKTTQFWALPIPFSETVGFEESLYSLPLEVHGNALYL